MANNYGFLFSYDDELNPKGRTRTSPSRGAKLYRTKGEARTFKSSLKKMGIMKGKNLRIVKATKGEYLDFLKNM